jgi:hypothetical protein
MYVHYITRLCEYFLAFYVTGYVHTWDIGMWLVLVRNGLSCPMLIVDWLCHTLLLGELFIDVFTFFPRVLFGLVVLVWALGLGFPMPHMHTHCYKLNYHIQSWISGTHIHIVNHIYHISGKDQTDLLFPTPSVGNNNLPIIGIKCWKKNSKLTTMQIKKNNFEVLCFRIFCISHVLISFQLAMLH